MDDPVTKWDPHKILVVLFDYLYAEDRIMAVSQLGALASHLERGGAFPGEWLFQDLETGRAQVKSTTPLWLNRWQHTLQTWKKPAKKGARKKP